MQGRRMSLQGIALNTRLELGQTKSWEPEDGFRGLGGNNCCQNHAGQVAGDGNRLGQECISFHIRSPGRMPGFPMAQLSH
jgi:hypothetical protein